MFQLILWKGQPEPGAVQHIRRFVRRKNIIKLLLSHTYVTDFNMIVHVLKINQNLT